MSDIASSDKKPTKKTKKPTGGGRLGEYTRPGTPSQVPYQPGGGMLPGGGNK